MKDGASKSEGVFCRSYTNKRFSIAKISGAVQFPVPWESFYNSFHFFTLKCL